MFIEHILWIVPAVLIAAYQVKFIWSKLPLPNHEDTEIPGHYTNLDRLRLDYLVRFLCFILWIQIVIPLLTISDNIQIIFMLKLLGYLLILTGFWVSLTALKTLGNNWSGLSDYRIKKNQQLVTTGVYKYVRHPIYLAAMLEVLGYELLVNSWLSIIFIAIIYIIVTKHLIREEAQLEQKFGKQFIAYKQKTKMFIPYLI